MNAPHAVTRWSLEVASSSDCSRRSHRSLLARSMQLAAIAALLAACAPSGPDTLFIESKTEQGLLTLSKVTAKAHVQLLSAKGNSANFRSDIIPSSAISVAWRGRLSVAKGSVLMRWSDVDGKEHVERASPGAAAEWSGYVRTVSFRQKNEENGFRVALEPVDGTPRQAEGVVMDVVYGPGALAGR
jgi:hypothetical protein